MVLFCNFYYNKRIFLKVFSSIFDFCLFIGVFLGKQGLAMTLYPTRLSMISVSEFSFIVIVSDQ